MYQVLLVDDEYMILEGLKWIIPWKECGFEIAAVARSAREALKQLEQYAIDVMISDVNMPEMTGLELLAEAKKDNPELLTLILSGYQEFNYVQKAMELDTKGYLLKPVDKQELRAKMMAFKELLDARENEKKRQRTYQDGFMSLWLNDELSEDELQGFIYPKTIDSFTGFTVVHVSCHGKMSNIEDFLQEHHQLFYMIRQEKVPVLTMIVVGEQAESNEWIGLFQENFADAIDKMIVGETVTDWDNVYESYNQVQKFLFFDTENGAVTQIKKQKIEAPLTSLQFFSFNKSLMIGDRPTVHDHLKSIFQEMKQLEFTPDEVRHVAFLLFSDIYRQFPSLDRAIYQSMLSVIQKSETLENIQSCLFSVLDLTQQSMQMEKRYSQLVTAAIEMIQERYTEDLTLKCIAEELYINAVYLGQCFKSETERSFSQFLNQIRIQKAQQLLLYTPKSINEIAYETGYNTNHYFIKMFKKLNGMSPKEFRETYKDKYQAMLTL